MSILLDSIISLIVAPIIVGIVLALFKKLSNFLCK
ncbi:type I toxin-antitoxin system Fst family toxin [Lactobacillus helveticus]